MKLSNLLRPWKKSNDEDSLVEEQSINKKILVIS
jgi:hypothetical protein